MTHYICPECLTSLPDMGICENEACASRWEMMVECACTDDLHGRREALQPTKDAHGNVLKTGDSVVLIKDLTLRGTSQKIKQGTKVSVVLRDNPEEIDCKIGGTAIVLRTEFLKKV